MSDPGATHKKLSNNLVALSSAAVLAVYTAGYVRTKSAADRFATQAATRRPMTPAPSPAAPAAVIPDAPAPPPRTAEAPEKSPARTDARATAAAAPPAVKPPASPRTPARRVAVTKTTPAAAVPPSPAAAPELPVAVVDQMAPLPVPAAPEPPKPAKPQYKDGTYLGWGSSRHGDIQAQVVIEGGRILSATIAQCLTRYSCSVIATLPPQVAQRQSPETDYVSGATQSTDAFYYAVVDALSKAK